MDRRTIIIGVAVLALIIIVWYFMFRKDGEPDTSDLPIVSLGNVSQTVRSYDTDDSFEEYRIEYYTDAELSAYIDFTVEWTNGFGFQNVTHLKVIHKVNGNELRSVTFDSGDKIKNFKGPHIVEFKGSDLASDTNVPDNMNNKRHVKGTSTFEIKISTDGTNYSTPRTVPSEASFPSITITDKELNIPLEVARGRSVNYTFEPVLSSDRIVVKTDFLDKEYFIHPYTEKKSIQSSLKLDDFVQRYTPIVISKSSTTPPAATGDATTPPPPVNLYLKFEDKSKKTITFNVLYVDGDGRLQVLTQGSTIPGNGNKDFYILESALNSTSSNKYYHIKEYGKDDNFIVLNKISDSDEYHFRSENIKEIKDSEKYKTIEFVFATSSDGLDVDCEQTSEPKTACQTKNSDKMCGELSSRRTLNRGEKCVKIIHTTKQSGSGNACPNPEGEIIENCPVNCVYERNDEPRIGTKCNQTCKRSSDPSKAYYDYTKVLEEKHGGVCPNAPTALEEPCPSDPCDDCEWKKDPRDILGKCSEDLTNHPRMRLFNRIMDDTGYCEPSPNQGKLYVPDNTCPDRAQCERKKVNTGICYQPYPLYHDYYERVESKLVSNPHGRPSTELACNPDTVIIPTKTDKCSRGNCYYPSTSGSNRVVATRCGKNNITKEECMSIDTGSTTAPKCYFSEITGLKSILR